MKQPRPCAHPHHTQELQLWLSQHVWDAPNPFIPGKPQPRGTNPGPPGLGAEEKYSKVRMRRRNGFKSSLSPAWGLELNFPMILNIPWPCLPTAHLLPWQPPRPRFAIQAREAIGAGVSHTSWQALGPRFPLRRKTQAQKIKKSTF